MRRGPFLQLVVVGDEGRARNEVGLSLARSLHRPLLEVGDPPVLEALDADQEKSDARSRLKRLLSISTAAVIAAPRLVLDDDGLTGDEKTGTSVWTVLVVDASASGETDEGRGLVDAFITAEFPVDDGKVADLVGEFRDASQRITR